MGSPHSESRAASVSGSADDRPKRVDAWALTMCVCRVSVRLLRMTVVVALGACAAGGAGQTESGQRPRRTRASENAARASCPATRPTGSAVRELDAAAREEAIRRPDFSPPPDARSLTSLLQHFDASLLAYWVAAATPGERLMRVPVRRNRAAPQPTFVLCGYSRDVLGRSFAIVDSVEPRALDRLANGMRPVVSGRLTALIDSSMPTAVVTAVGDTLARLGKLFGVSEETPVLAFLFADQERFAARFPVGWIDGVFSDWTLAESGIGAAVFAASRATGIASHELVHVVLKGVHSQVDIRGSSIPYVAEEALARTLGGSRGRSYRELLGPPITVSDARRLIATQMQDAALSKVRFDARRPYEPAVDALGAVYRVALSACRVFPADLLDARAVTTLSAAVNRLAIHLRITPDAAADSIAVRLAAPGNVFESSFRRVESQRLACEPYAVPLERAHPP